MASSSAPGSRKRGRQTPPQAAATGEESQEAPPPLHSHELLSFHPDTDAYRRLAQIVETPLLQHRTFDWELMARFGMRQQLEALIPARWMPFFRIPQRQYVELTLEFFSTFVLRRGSLTAADAVQFSLGASQHHMTIADFAQLLGLYSEEEVTQPIFTESLRGVVQSPHALGVTGEQLAAWWPAIGDGAFMPSTNASWIRDPLHRYLHRIIACTISGRHLSIEKVSEFDLFILHCLLEPAPGNLATILLYSLGRPRSKAARLAQGPYVTWIAESLDILDPIADTLTEGPRTIPYPLADMIQMEVVTDTTPPTFRPRPVPEPVPVPEGIDPATAPPITRPPARQRRTRRPPQVAAGERPATLDSIRAEIRELRRTVDLQGEILRYMLQQSGTPIPARFLPPQSPSDEAGPSAPSGPPDA